jgi:hypothetical protein
LLLDVLRAHDESRPTVGTHLGQRCIAEVVTAALRCIGRFRVVVVASSQHFVQQAEAGDARERPDEPARG